MQQFGAAQTLLSRVQLQTPTPSLNSTPLSTPLSSRQEVIEPCYGVEPHTDLVEPFYNMGELLADLDIARLDADTEFSHESFSSRKVGYYGDHPYKYAGGSTELVQ